MLVSLGVPGQVSGHLLLCHKTLVTLLTVINNLGLPGVHRFMPLQLRRTVKDFAADAARVTLVWIVAFQMVRGPLLGVR